MPSPEAAVAIVHAHGPQESVLLIRRAEREDDPWSGHWSFPGGRRELEDADLLDTAIRELAEECGIRLRRDQKEAALPATNAGRRHGRVVLVSPFLFRVDEVMPTVLDPEEAADAQWIPLELLRDPAQHGLRPVQRLPKEMAFPAIELNGTPLWGFTYRVITAWLGLHAPASSPDRPGFEAAGRVLEFLLAEGLTLQQPWEDAAESDAPACKVARVGGAIPVAAVLAHFARPRAHFPSVNLLEVKPDHIRVVGLALEEYLIRAE
jgi:8-oxo-dGTP pyrophosphatase MutT (NUDIX family)